MKSDWIIVTDAYTGFKLIRRKSVIIGFGPADPDALVMRPCPDARAHVVIDYGHAKAFVHVKETIEQLAAELDAPLP